MNVTGSPFMNSSPLSGAWTPDRILISVDLPAPLSPSTHVTSPALTFREMSWSALTDPKYFETERASSRQPFISEASMVIASP